MLRLSLLCQVLTDRERRRFESNSYPVGGLFLALTQASPVGEPMGHLWYDSGIAAPISAALPGLPLCQGGQEFELTCLWAYAKGPPHTALHPVVRTLYLPVFRPESYYSASRSERVIRPTKCQACIQHDKRTYNGRSIAATDGVTTTLQNSARLKSNSSGSIHDSTYRPS